jgi:hypothetical protein
VNWPDLIALLKRNHYTGEYAIEDFLAPNTSKLAAIAYLTKARSQFCHLYEPTSTVGAVARHGEPNWSRFGVSRIEVTPTAEATLTIDASKSLEGHHV